MEQLPYGDGLQDVEYDRVVRFDENHRPYMTVVPVPARTPARAPQYAPSYTQTGEITVYKQVQPPYPYYPPAPQQPYSPVRDPWIWRILTGAIAVSAVSFSVSFLLEALAAATKALGFLMVVLILIWLLRKDGGGSDKSVNISFTNSNKSKHRN